MSDFSFRRMLRRLLLGRQPHPLSDMPGPLKDDEFISMQVFSGT
jgi:hypothetical protein